MLLFILHYSHSISSAFAQKNYILFWNTIFQDKYSVIHFCLNPAYIKKKDCILYVFHIQSFSIHLLIALFQRLPRRRSRFSRILLSRPICLMNPDQVTLILIGKVEGNHILQLAAQLADRTFSRLHLFLQFA